MKFAVLDLETTGDRVNRDEIIQVGLVIIHDFEIKRRYSSFIRPSGAIPPFIRSLTGITDEMVADAPLLEDVVTELLPLLEDAVLVAHNAAFDVNFLQDALVTCGYEPFNGRVLDTMDWLKMLFPSLAGYQLAYVSSVFGVSHERAHQADSDAEATAAIWLRCLEKLADLPLLALERIGFLFAHPDFRSQDNAWFLEQIISWRNNTADTSAQHFPSFRQFVLAAGDWLGEPEADNEPLLDDFPTFYDEMKQRLSEAVEGYEERPAQKQMMMEVADSLHEGRHLVIEAGTGTGKSLGYLLPAIHFALQTGEKVVVSTHTINLQEQLRTKELPLLETIAPVPFRSAILKGRSHYLCLRKFEAKVNNQDFQYEYEDRITASQMMIWLAETVRGDQEELNLGQKGGEFWDTVASDADSCLNRSCPWFRKCFYHRARNEAIEADVIVTNHSLLFTDCLAEHRILPSYTRLVIDEAHHLEDVASQHLGVELSYFTINNALMKLMKDQRSGQLPMLKLLIEQHPNPATEGWGAKIGRLIPEIVKVKEAWDELIQALYDRFFSNLFTAAPENGSTTVRLKAGQLPKDWDTFSVMGENVHVSLTEILKELDRLLAEAKEASEDFGLESLFTDLAGTVKDVYRARDAMRFIMEAGDPNFVYWMEAHPYYKARSFRMHASPVDVSGLMREYFWERKEAVVMTSATLTVEKSFQYVMNQLGLMELEQDPAKLHAVQLPSPFQYREQALVLIPRDFPGLKGADAETEFIERLAESLQNTAVVTNGKMLVLFTSNKMLKQTHSLLKDALQPYGIHVYGQGVDSGNRSKLTRLFMMSESAVLLGTSSFWEGVDLPGEALTVLAIVRLPFQPPNHPRFEAKSEFLRKKNQNPFTKLSVPQAVIKFKQGFGRLVRTAQDKGVVLIYDTRVIETSYGKHFLYSLPGPKIEHLLSASIPERIREWYATTKQR